jgi:hypothetical protein
MTGACHHVQLYWLRWGLIFVRLALNHNPSILLDDMSACRQRAQESHLWPPGHGTQPGHRGTSVSDRRGAGRRGKVGTEASLGWPWREFYCKPFLSRGQVNGQGGQAGSLCGRTSE